MSFPPPFDFGAWLASLADRLPDLAAPSSPAASDGPHYGLHVKVARCASPDAVAGGSMPVLLVDLTPSEVGAIAHGALAYLSARASVLGVVPAVPSEVDGEEEEDGPPRPRFVRTEEEREHAAAWLDAVYAGADWRHALKTEAGAAASLAVRLGWCPAATARAMFAGMSLNDALDARQEHAAAGWPTVTDVGLARVLVGAGNLVHLGWQLGEVSTADARALRVGPFPGEAAAS